MTAATRRTAKVFALLLAGYVLLCLPALVWPKWMDTPAGLLVAVPFLTAYALRALGVPGLVQNDGACGWGWCPPTLLGWLAAALVWCAIGWLCARAIAAVTGGGRDEDRVPGPPRESDAPDARSRGSFEP